MIGSDPRPGSPARAAERPQRADIQALRALAVVLVLAYHLWPEAVSGGYVGVDAFFVISGFLITGHLAKEAASGRLSLTTFWIRRARRLLPSSLLVLGLSALATFAWLARHSWRQTFREIIASGVYVQNWVLARDSIDYLASTNKPSIVQHYWTLSMEEQFYIALPLILVLALKLRLRIALVPHLLAAIAASSFLYSVYLTSENGPVAYFATTTRAWEFAAGGVLATANWRAPRRLQGVAFWAGVGLVLAAGLSFGEDTPFPGYLASIPVVGAALVIWAGKTGGLAGRIVTPRPVQFLGDISYALYLWHWPLVLLAPRFLGEVGTWHKLAIAVLAILLAWLTTEFVELPIRSRPIRPGTGRSVLTWSAAGAAAVVSISWFGLRSIQVDEAAIAALTGSYRDADPECFGAAAMVNPCPAATTIVPDVELVAADQANRRGCWSNNGDSTLRICTLGPATGYTRRLMAIGDSRSNALISAYAWIAETAGWRIDVAGKGGCYLTAATIRHFTLQYRAECEDWLRQLRIHLRRSGPYDALLVTHREGFPLLPNGQPPFETEVAGLAGAWSRVTANGGRVIAIRDVPRMPQDVVTCVQRHRLSSDRECAVDRSAAFPGPDSQQQAALRVEGAHFVDLSDLYCSERCYPVIGGVAVYQSWGHITATFGRTLAPYLLAEIESLLD
ncbi:MAG: acyltransferase [Thermoanaerobaculia bacterium]|nr:MAG: acyltransferase [Thermoanaerobaculia bacterium]